MDTVNIRKDDQRKEAKLDSNKGKMGIVPRETWEQNAFDTDMDYLINHFASHDAKINENFYEKCDS